MRGGHFLFKGQNCFFCGRNTTEDFFIQIGNPVEQMLISSRALTGCDCFFTTHGCCWDTYIKSPIYKGCPNCNKAIPDIKHKKSKGFIYRIIWKYEIATWKKIVLFFLMVIGIYFLNMYVSHFYNGSLRRK
jgi:hypothetical protein